MPPPDWLGEIARTQKLKDDISSTQIAAIKGARKAGHAWKAIGEALGITQQGARQRFKWIDDA